ncbi:helix-turn-helix transcriptional regulator [Micromonospora maritima]|uniref:helix-turn-helix transcriptional regulator n=1 Tax=Micromonospora maritima TaxID=986711 RepID=UPI00157CC8DB|nr:helix-turn-helix domain-containing protein [Micromonospora maritima]
MSFEADELLTIDETTSVLGISRMTLWRATRDGDLHSVVVPGSGRDGAKRYSRHELAALLTRCTVGAERKEGDVVEHPGLGRLTPLKEFAVANGIPWRGLAKAARETPPRFEHVLWNGRRYLTERQQQAFLDRNTVTVREEGEDDELAAERERIARSRSRRSSSRRSTTRSRAAA